MTIISSQHHIDWEIVEKKIDGTEYAMQNDKHHTLAAARELGIAVEFDITNDLEDLEGEALLEQRYNDGDWYNVETSNPAYYEFDLVW